MSGSDLVGPKLVDVCVNRATNSPDVLWMSRGLTL